MDGHENKGSYGSNRRDQVKFQAEGVDSSGDEAGKNSTGRGLSNRESKVRARLSDFDTSSLTMGKSGYRGGQSGLGRFQGASNVTTPVVEEKNSVITRINFPAELKKDRANFYTNLPKAPGSVGSEGSGRVKQNATSNVSDVAGFVGRKGLAISSGNERLDGVLERIRRNWSFMASERCVPVQVALQLLDTSSLGLASRSESFYEIYEELKVALKSIVNENCHGFNSAISIYHDLQASMQASLNRLRLLRSTLCKAKSSLSTSKPELRSLVSASKNHEDVLHILRMIENVQSIPEKLETWISEKRFMGAVDILEYGLEVMKLPELKSINGLRGIQAYLKGQNGTLVDIVVEELVNHLYLKSPYSESRWKVYMPVGMGNGMEGSESNRMSLVKGRSRSYAIFLGQLDSEDGMVMTDETMRNPEADNFEYIRLLVGVLGRMNKLEMALNMIKERSKDELKRIMNKCYGEVNQSLVTGSGSSFSEYNIAIGRELTQFFPQLRVLGDFLWRYFARLEAILEAHRVMFEVMGRLKVMKGEEVDGQDVVKQGMGEIWGNCEVEIGKILVEYITKRAKHGIKEGDLIQGSEISNVYSKRNRDTSQWLFKLSEMESNGTAKEGNENGEVVDDLDTILKYCVPGLMSEIRPSNNVKMEKQSARGRWREGGDDRQGKLLIETTIFNIGPLLEPTANFLSRIKDIVGCKGSGITRKTLNRTLSEFIEGEFYEQVSESLHTIIERVFSDGESFQADLQWNRREPKSLMTGVANLTRVFETFCCLLSRLTYRRKFSELLIERMEACYGKFEGYFKTLISKSALLEKRDDDVKTSAVLANEPEFKQVLNALAIADEDQVGELITRETDLLIGRLKDHQFHDSDVILNRKTIASMCLLFNSMKWMGAKLRSLRKIVSLGDELNRGIVAMESHEMMTRASFAFSSRWDLSSVLRISEEIIYLRIDQALTEPYERMVTRYEALATRILRILRLEFRTRVMLYLRKPVWTKYQHEQIVDDPEPEVIALNAKLIEFDDEVCAYFASPEHDFIVDGVESFMDQEIVDRLSHVAALNTSGCARMQLNILVLQQNLKNIVS